MKWRSYNCLRHRRLKEKLSYSKFFELKKFRAPPYFTRLGEYFWWKYEVIIRIKIMKVVWNIYRQWIKCTWYWDIRCCGGLVDCEKQSVMFICPNCEYYLVHFCILVPHLSAIMLIPFHFVKSFMESFKKVFDANFNCSKFYQKLHIKYVILQYIFQWLTWANGRTNCCNYLNPFQIF